MTRPEQQKRGEHCAWLVAAMVLVAVILGLSSCGALRLYPPTVTQRDVRAAYQNLWTFDEYRRGFVFVTNFETRFTGVRLNYGANTNYEAWEYPFIRQYLVTDKHGRVVGPAKTLGTNWNSALPL